MAKRLKGVPNLPFAPIVALLFGIVAAVLVFATPAWLLERTVASLGISELLTAARPPLGDTARSTIAIATGFAAALLLWVVMRPIEKFIHGRRTARPLSPEATTAPTVNDSSAWTPRSTRPPIFAGDELGAPLMSDEALASGGELFLDPSMVEAPVAVPVVEVEVEVEVAPAPVAKDHGWIEFVSSAQSETSDGNPDPLAFPIPASPESARPQLTPEWPTPVAAEPLLVAEPEKLSDDNEPSLQHLLHRLESALDRRTALAEHGGPLSNPPPATTVASLRNLIEVSTKNAA